jgi:NAD(P)-dependent dehydrogenase (short-subunit alcohol dehydrogenase family)
LVCALGIVVLAVGLLLSPGALAVGLAGPGGRGAEATGRGGAAASADEYATNAGLEILRKGGNAVDAAVATAAVLGVTKPFWCGIGGGGLLGEMKEEDFDRVIAVHLKGTFLCSQAAIPHMKKNQWGRIVNITSRAAYKGRIGVGAYSAAKGGILSMSRVLAHEVAPYGINVNNVAPGTAETKMVKTNFSTPEARMQEATFTGVITRPIRLAYPEEIAAAIMFLCSEASAHITGTTIHVNGGTFMP